MQPVIFADQMREIDRLTVERYQIPSLLLMEAAANACFRAVQAKFDDDLINKKALVLCGKGNNGGDGAALARCFSRAGVHSDVVLFGKLADTKGDARTNFEALSQLASFQAGSAAHPAPLTFVECEEVSVWEQIARPRSTYDIIVDALFGTGLTRPLDDLFVKVTEHLAMLTSARDRAAATRPLVLAVDLPSGLDADKANPIGPTVQADLTVTFTAPKPANVLPPASYCGGELVIADIGSPESLIENAKPWLFVTEADDARQWLVRTRYTKDSYKNTHGHVLVVAGSRDYSGAAALCGNAAMSSGAGLVTVATPAAAQPAVTARLMPEVMTTALAETDRGVVSERAIDHFLQITAKASAVVIGPGLTSDDERSRRFVRAVVERRTVPTVVDADGLNCLAPWPTSLFGSDEVPIILTPHPGEMQRLIGANNKSAQAGRVSVAREFAAAHKLILVLKGSRSLVAAPDGRVFINPTGNAGAGTAGAGDTLAGIITGFVAQSYATLRDQADPLAATLAALYVAGLGADFAARKLGMRTMVASDIREHLSAAICSLDRQGEMP